MIVQITCVKVGHHQALIPKPRLFETGFFIGGVLVVLTAWFDRMGLLLDLLKCCLDETLTVA